MSSVDNSIRNKNIVYSYKSGRTLRDIANVFNLSYERVRKILKENKVRRRSAGTQKTPLIKEAFVLSKYKGGLSTIEIGKEINLHPSTIRNILIRNKIKLRKRNYERF